MSINLRVSSFETFDRFVESAVPFWTQVVRMASRPCRHSG